MLLRTPPMPPRRAHRTLPPHATAPPQPDGPPPLAQHIPPALQQQHGTPSQPHPVLRPAATAPQRAAAYPLRDRQRPRNQPHAAPPEPAAASHRTPVSPGPARMPARAPQPRFRSGAPRKACAVFRAPGRARSAPRHRRAVATRPAYHSVSFVTGYLPPKIEKNSELFRTRPLSGLRNGAVGPATRLRTPRRRCARPGRAPPHRPIPAGSSTAGQPFRTPPAMPSRDLRQGPPRVRTPPAPHTKPCDDEKSRRHPANRCRDSVFLPIFAGRQRDT